MLKMYEQDYLGVDTVIKGKNLMFAQIPEGFTYRVKKISLGHYHDDDDDDDDDFENNGDDTENDNVTLSELDSVYEVNGQSLRWIHEGLPGQHRPGVFIPCISLSLQFIPRSFPK